MDTASKKGQQPCNIEDVYIGFNPTRIMKKHLKAIGTTDTWITPKYITEALGEFDLDPCAHTEMPWQHANKCYTVDDDGLSSTWFGRVWLNPPFNQYQLPLWMAKMAKHKNGIMFISAALETKRFKDYVWGGKAIGVLALDYRPYFHLPDGSRGRANSGQTMCLIAYDEENWQCLLNSALGVPLTEVKVDEQALARVKSCI